TNIALVESARDRIFNKDAAHIADENILSLVVDLAARLLVDHWAGLVDQLVEVVILPGVTALIGPPIIEVAWIDKVSAPLQQAEINFMGGELIHIEVALLIFDRGIDSEGFFEHILDGLGFTHILPLACPQFQSGEAVAILKAGLFHQLL